MLFCIFPLQNEIMEQPHSKKNQAIRIVVICIALLVVMCAPFPVMSGSIFSVCIHYRLLGVQCPLCGMTHAVHQFMHLRFISAIQYNPVVILLPLYVVFDVATCLFDANWLKGIKKWIVISILASLLALYVYRIGDYFQWF